jgi:hypothetical protein
MAPVHVEPPMQNVTILKNWRLTSPKRDILEKASLPFTFACSQ